MRARFNKNLAITAVFLIALFFVFALFGFSLKNGWFNKFTTRLITASIIDTLKNKETDDNNQDEDFLGGPSGSGEDESLLSNQALIDFTADDEAEEIDFNTIQENSIIASTNPSLVNQFINIKRDIIAYAVQSGDIPEKIAASFGINTNTLLWANNLRDGDLIRPGDKLTILPINGIRHKVQSGNTIAGLAKKYQADAEEISQFNSLATEQALKIGDYIIIPDGEMPALPKPKINIPKFSSISLPSSDWLIMPTTGRNWGRKHGFNGVDIANQCGTPIYAAAAGNISLVDVIGWNGGYGKNIRIQHPNGVVTLYAHLSQALVGQGQTVSQGQPIALIGSTGRSTGCHVHFEVRGAKNPFIWK